MIQVLSDRSTIKVTKSEEEKKEEEQLNRSKFYTVTTKPTNNYLNSVQYETRIRALYNLTMTDEFGNTALHLSCYHQAPLQSVKYLIHLSKLVVCNQEGLFPSESILKEKPFTPDSILCPVASACKRSKRMIQIPQQLQQRHENKSDNTCGRLDLRLKLAKDGSTPFLVACVFYDKVFDLGFLIFKNHVMKKLGSGYNDDDDEQQDEEENENSIQYEMRCVRQVAIQPDQSGSTPLLEIIRGCERFIGGGGKNSKRIILSATEERAKHKLQSKIALVLRAATVFTKEDLINAQKYINKEEEDGTMTDAEYHLFLLKAFATVPHACPSRWMIHDNLNYCCLEERAIVKLFHNSISNSVLNFFTTKSSSFCDYSGVTLSATSYSINNEKQMRQPLSLIFVNTERQLQVLCNGQNDVVKGLLDYCPNVARVLVPIAIMKRTMTKGSEDDNSEFINNSNNNAQIVETNKKVSRTMIISTKYGWRSPLCHAISCGLWWSTVCEGLQREEGMSDDIISGPLRHIWQRAPEALERRDLTTGLYPFMIAATVTYNNNDRIEKGTYIESKLSKLQIGTIYGLLRTFPQVMDMVLSNSNK